MNASFLVCSPIAHDSGGDVLRRQAQLSGSALFPRHRAGPQPVHSRLQSARQRPHQGLPHRRSPRSSRRPGRPDPRRLLLRHWPPLVPRGGSPPFSLRVTSDRTSLFFPSTCNLSLLSSALHLYRVSTARGRHRLPRAIIRKKESIHEKEGQEGRQESPQEGQVIHRNIEFESVGR